MTDPAFTPAPTRGWPWAALVGVLAGVMSGLFGVGGGIVMVPLFVGLFALDQRRASATSLLAIIPIATASAAGYAVSGNVEYGAALLLVIGGVVGGQLGAWLLPRTPISTLQLWFGLLSIATAVRLLFESNPSGAGTLTALHAVLLVGVGVASGVLAGLLGVGGGVVMVPGLILLAGADANQARGTSLLVIIVTALTATFTNLRNGLVETRTGLIAGLCGIPAGWVGAKLGQWLPEKVALALFAALLVLSGIRAISKSRESRSAAEAQSA